MGHRKSENWRAEEWRAAAPYVEAMIRFGWSVIAKCQKCGLTTHVDLRVIAKLKGSKYDLWNKTAPCKRVGCTDGVAHFQFRPPELTRYQVMSAGWPPGFVGMRDDKSGTG
jgi:hypothetical protein